MPDLTKPLNTVDHGNLCNNLYRCSIRRIALILIKYYLSDRKQRVITKEHKSNNLNANIDVFQKTILGSLLHLLYINVQCDEFPEGILFSFVNVQCGSAALIASEPSCSKLIYYTWINLFCKS